MTGAVSHRFLWSLAIAVIAVSGLVLLMPVVMGSDRGSPVFVQNGMSLESQIFVLRDASARRGIAEIADPRHAADFRRATMRDFTPGYTRDAIWYAVTLVNPHALPQEFYFEIGPPRLPDVQLHFRDADGHWQLLRGGLHVAIKQRLIQARQSVFPLRLEAGEQRTLYVRITGENALMFDARLWSPGAFNDAQRHVDLVNGLQFGAVFLFALYAVLLFLGTREKAFLHFGITLFAFGFYDISIFEYGYQYLWPSAPDWAMRSPGVFLALTFFGGGMLVAELLRTRQQFPLTDRCLRGLAWLGLATIPLLLVLDYGSIVRVVNMLALLMVLLNLGATLHALARGYRGAGLFLLAFSLLWFTSFIRICQIVGLLPYNLLTDYSQTWSMVVSGMLMAIALSDNVRRLRMDRELAQQAAITARIEARIQAEQDVELRTRELRMARDLAQAASDAKSTLLAHLSHELRTPLHSILGYSGLIRSDSNSSVDKRRIEAVQRSGRHLLELIDELLDYARIEAGRLRLELRPVYLQSFLESVLEESRELARSCGTQLQADIAPSLPAVVMLDNVRLRQVLVNLIANACRHSQSTLVALEVSVAVADTGILHLYIGVRDNGVGVSESDRERIFGAFEQGNTQSNRHGMGLGLAISRQLVQLMGGQLLHMAPAEGGSLFHFCIDVEPAEETGMVPMQGSAIARRYAGPLRRILVVDNIADNRALLADVLASFGFELALAESGERALELLVEGPFDAVITAQLMPGISGWEFLKRARESAYTMPFIMVSAAMPVLPDGWFPHHVFAAILMKPVEPDRLADVIADALDLEWEAAGPSPASKPSSLTLPSAEELERLREAVNQGLVSDIEDWVDHILATEPDCREFALAVRDSVRRLDLTGILRMTAGTSIS